MDPRAAIRERALATGFAAVGFAEARLAEEVRDGLRGFLAAGHHGDMGWLATHAERRASPTALWPEARSVVAVALEYGPEADPRAELEERGSGYLSVYARNRDYHDTLKGRLKELAGWLAARFATEVKVFVDTAPVMEKPLAAAAGLGWQGKHTNLLSRDLGNWFFLGEVFTTLALQPDTPAEDHCGRCRACLDACPTRAFPAPHRLDARRCISYLTIEHKDAIPRDLRPLMGNRIYGCDDCLAACPWNKFARLGHAAFRAREDLRAPPLADLLLLDDQSFRRFFSGSPVKRIGRDRFLRNVLIAAGNSRDRSLLPPVRRLLGDTSPLVRGAAVWAFGQLAEAADFAAEKARRTLPEDSPEVRAEWEAT